MDNIQIVNSIKNLCDEHNITITKLEETLGMSQGLISRWNKSEPSLSKIIDIADFFNVSLDEIIRYYNHDNTNDMFIKKLISETSNKNILWRKYDRTSTAPKKGIPSFYRRNIEFTSSDEEYEYFKNHTELHYYTQLMDGYITIYCRFNNNNIKNPDDIQLYIQPDKTAKLVLQDFPKNHLVSLWGKILYNSNYQGVPDEIKAEEFKNSFISEDYKKTSSITERNTLRHSLKRKTLPPTNKKEG